MIRSGRTLTINFIKQDEKITMGEWLDDASEEDVLTEQLENQELQDIDAIGVRQVRHVDDCSVCHIGFLTAQNESDTSLYKDCQNCNVSDELIEGVAMTEILKEIEDDIWGTESSHLF